MQPETDPTVVGYEPMTVSRLSEFLVGADDSLRWRYIAEFLEEFGWEPPIERLSLVEGAPRSTGDERWDAFLASLAEYLTARDGRAAPSWVGFAPLRQLWFPFNTRAARVDALVNAPAAFRRRGVYIAAQELGVA